MSSKAIGTFRSFPCRCSPLFPTRRERGDICALPMFASGALLKGLPLGPGYFFLSHFPGRRKTARSLEEDIGSQSFSRGLRPGLPPSLRNRLQPQGIRRAPGHQCPGALSGRLGKKEGKGTTRKGKGKEKVAIVGGGPGRTFLRLFSGEERVWGKSL